MLHPSSVLPSPQRLHLPASIPLYAFACLLQISLSFRRPSTHSLLTPLLPQLRLRRLPEPPLGVRGGGSSTHTEPHQRWLFAPGGGATATSAHPGRRRGGCCTPGGAASALYAAAWLSLPGRRRLRGGAGEGPSCVAAPPRGDPPPPSRPCRLAPTCGAARFHPRSSLRARPRPHAEIRCPHHGHAGRLPRAPPLGSIPGLSLRGHWCNRVHPM